MKPKYLARSLFGAMLFTLAALLLSIGSAAASGGVEDSYHGQMGLDTGLGMLEKWCALPNFSYEEQGEIQGWTGQSCNGCHIGAKWNPTRSQADCNMCHAEATETRATPPTIDDCALVCHAKDTAKRGDKFEPAYDVHIAAGFVCQDCHEKYDDGVSDHQFLKGNAMDTTEPTMAGSLSCTTQCHLESPHVGKGYKSASKAATLNRHTDKVACETCHTGLRWGKALVSRQWNVFNAGKPVTAWKENGWKAVYKWYDNKGAGASGGFKLPILGHTERRGLEDAKIYPFNAVTVNWFVKTEGSDFDDVIIVPEVKAADTDANGTVTVEEMRKVYSQATLKTADMNFSISHSVLPADQAFECKDCHGRNAWVLDWKQLGYAKDPRSKSSGGGRKK